MLRKLEKYEIQEEIGHGGMATVYRAHDTVLDRDVALKVMHPHLRGAEEARARFHREARSVARLRHPKVLEIYDFSGQGSEEAYIAAELLTGPTLKRWREDTPQVPAEVAACVVIEICAALTCAHKAGIIHRDVKPENVLLHEDRTLKLTDFGIADMMDAQSMTATGQILGSPGHMAPEQIEGKPTDPRTDLFSLGTVLYYLATGRLPFTGRNPHQILKRIMDGEYADPLRVNPTLGGELRSIIVKSLERDPEARFQTAEDMRQTLKAFVAKAGIDDSEALLARYLVDPKAVGDEVRAKAVESLIRRGSAASDEGDVPLALDCYNRVLAIDDGNERVLRLIEKVGVDRRRRSAFLLGGALLLVGVTSGALAWSFWPEPGPAGGDGDPVAVLDAGVGQDAASVDAGAPDSSLDDAGDIPDANTTGDAGPQTPPDAGRRVRRDAGRRRPIAAPARSREVLFISSLSNFTVSIDGAPPRPLDEVRRSELSVGPHRLVLQPGAGVTSYQTTTLRIQVPPGQDSYDQRIALSLAPASIFVRSNVAGTVRVRSGSGATRASGPTGELLLIPMQRSDEVLRIQVEAAGYEPRERRPTLFAGGDVEQLAFTLSPAPE